MAFNVAVLYVLIISVWSDTFAEDIKCNSAGYFCDPSCKTLFRCIDYGFGDLRLETLFTCGNNQFCNIDTKSCSFQPDHCSKIQQVQCNDVGYFMYPYNCTVFFTCNSVNEPPGMNYCPYGYIADPCNFRCREGTCSSVPVPVCNSVLQSGGVPGGNNKYYVCNENLYPQQYSCGNRTFDDSTKQCTGTRSTCL